MGLFQLFFPVVVATKIFLTRPWFKRNALLRPMDFKSRIKLPNALKLQKELGWSVLF